MPDSVAAVRQMIAARGLDPDPDLVSQEAHLAFTYLSSPQQQQGTLPPRVQDAAQLAGLALMLTDLMATGSTYRTLQMLKRHPGLLQLQPSEVAQRVLQLKLLMPTADISQLLYQKPTLLLLDDLPGVVGAALAKLHALMPGIPVESKLHEGGTVFWSFSSLIQDKAARRAGSAHAASSSSSTGAAGDGRMSAPEDVHGLPLQQHMSSIRWEGPYPASPDASLQQQQC